MPTLDQLAIGQPAMIDAMEGPPPVVQRLLEMGLTEGQPIEIVRVAPLGDPIEIRVRGYELSLRKQEARWITVRVAEAGR